MKFTLYGILISIFCSCHFFGINNGIEFAIVNESDSPIKDIQFTTSENILIKEFDVIETNKSVSGFLSMKDNKVDGTYVLKFTRINEESDSIYYGYYTNGAALDSWVKFVVENDTITGKDSGRGY